MLRRIAAIVASALLTAAPWGFAAAMPSTPAGLQPGDTYQYLFVTAGTHDATSSDISVYNQFVTAQANAPGSLFAGSGLGWSAVASTASISAFANAPVLAPVYLPDGTQLATGYGDFWDGGQAALPDVNQFGAVQGGFASGFVYTGSLPDGSPYSPYVLGGTGGVEFGADFTNGPGWITDDSFGGSTPLPFYALSTPITVPSPGTGSPGTGVPAPPALTLCALGLVFVAAGSRRRAKRRT